MLCSAGTWLIPIVAEPGWQEIFEREATFFQLSSSGYLFKRIHLKRQLQGNFLKLAFAQLEKEEIETGAKTDMNTRKVAYTEIFVHKMIA